MDGMLVMDSDVYCEIIWQNTNYCLKAVPIKKKKRGEGAVFPLRPYGAQLAQVLEKLAQQILCQCVKKMLFLGKSAYFQQKLEILAQ